jgi:translation initiation factor 2B subunit (eIF-2B alpha/beta/delta family)
MTSRVSYTFSAGQADPMTSVDGMSSVSTSLAEHLAECVNDTGTSAAELSRQTASKAQEWFFDRPLTWEAKEAAPMLEEALSALESKHGWRGVMATWIDRVRATFHFACENRDQGSLRSLLIEEMGAWMNTGDDENPQALERDLRSDGPRTTQARAVAPHATKPMGAGETVLVLGWTPELVECCRAAHRAGLKPELLIPVGHPELIGRGMARDAARFGLRARLVLDAALWEAARAADRVWVGTESIGVEHVVTPAGVVGIAELCENEEIPLELISTTDSIHPSALGVAAPAGDPDRIWGERPAGVAVEASFTESVPTRAFHRWYCEHGSVGFNSEAWAPKVGRPALCAAPEVTENKPAELTAARTKAERA